MTPPCDPKQWKILIIQEIMKKWYFSENERMGCSKFMFVPLRVVEEVLRPLKNVQNLRKGVDCILDDVWNMWKYEFGWRFISIGLEKSAMAAAIVVEGLSRSSNKEVKSVDVYKTSARIICSPSPRRARATDLHQPLMRQNPIEQALFGE